MRSNLQTIKEKRSLWCSKKSSAFTLIEAAVALLVTAAGLFVIFGLANGVNKQVDSTQTTNRFEWERFVSLFQNEQQHFYLIPDSVDLHEFNVYSKEADNVYVVYYNYRKNKVIMKGQSKGYMPLLYNVYGFDVDLEGEVLNITADVGDRTYKTQLFLPFKEDKK